MKKIFLSIIIIVTGSCIMAQSQRIEFMAPGTYPEGVVYYQPSDVFYVSSARMGSIGKVTPAGAYSDVYVDSTLKSTFGMKIDAGKKMLWALAGDPNYSKYRDSSTYKKMIRLIGIDLNTGNKTKDIDLSGIYKGMHFGNDMALDNNGNIYITDSYSPVIYKVDAAGKASVFAQSDWFASAGVGLNGIVYHPAGFLIAANNGNGCLLRVDIAQPSRVGKIMVNQFFPGADGLLLKDNNNLVLVQNKGTNKVFNLTSNDDWKTAMVSSATPASAMFAYPSTATMRNNDLWIMNAKLSELADSLNVISEKFSIQKANLEAIK